MDQVEFLVELILDNLEKENPIIFSLNFVRWINEERSTNVLNEDLLDKLINEKDEKSIQIYFLLLLLVHREKVFEEFFCYVRFQLNDNENKIHPIEIPNIDRLINNSNRNEDQNSHLFDTNSLIFDLLNKVLTKKKIENEEESNGFSSDFRVFLLNFQIEFLFDYRLNGRRSKEFC